MAMRDPPKPAPTIPTSKSAGIHNPQILPPQFAHSIRGSIFCRRFIRDNRSDRERRQAEQRENFSKSQRSANTRPRLRQRPYSRATSRSASEGGLKLASVASASSAPLPNRVGITETTVAPQSKAKSIERLLQVADSSSF